MKKKSLIVFITTCGGSIALLPSCSGFTYRTPNSLHIEDLTAAKGIEQSFVPTIVTGDDDPSLDAYELEFAPENKEEMKDASYSFLKSSSESGEHMYTVKIDKAGYYRFTASLKNFKNSKVTTTFQIRVDENAYNLTAISEDKAKGVTAGSTLGYEGKTYKVNAYPNNGYVFEGWYLQGRTERLSDKAEYVYTMGNYDATLVAKFVPGKYKIHLRSNDEKMGYIKKYGNADLEVPFGDEMSLTAVAKEGYTFKGWKIDNNEEYETTSINYTFTKVASEHTITADFEETLYTVSVQSENDDHGSITILDNTNVTSVKRKKGEKIKVKVTENNPEKYKFQYLLVNGNKIPGKADEDIEITVEAKDMIVTAVFDVLTAKVDFIVIDENGKTIDSKEYTIDSSYYKNGIVIGSSSNPLMISFNENKYAFNGWFIGDTKVLDAHNGYCTKEITTETTFTAKLEKKVFHISTKLEAEDEGAQILCYKGGEEITESTSLYYGDELTFVYTPSATGVHTFKGFDGTGGLKDFKFIGEGSTTASLKLEPTDGCKNGQTYEVTARISNNPILTVINGEGGKTSGIVSGASLINEKYCQPNQANTVRAIPNDDYEFSYWSDANGNVLSTKDEFSYPIATASITLVSHFVKKTYSLSASSNNTLAGTATIKDGVKDKGQTIEKAEVGKIYTFTATSNDSSKYRFLHWEDAYGNVISEDATYSYTMDTFNYHLIAVFDFKGYALTVKPSALESYKNGTTEILSDPYYDNKFRPNNYVTIKATPENGYGFVGWYDGDEEDSELLSTDLVYYFKMPKTETNIYARFAKLCSIILKAEPINGEDIGFVTGATESAITGQEVTIKAELFNKSLSDVYTFEGWYEGEKKISDSKEYTFKASADISLTAKWVTSVTKTVTLKNNLEGFGVIKGDGEYLYGSSVTIEATSGSQFVQFEGWYSDAKFENLVTKDASFNIPKLTENKTYYANFKAGESWDKAHGVVPVINNEDQTLTYGLYPQTFVPNPSQGLQDAGEGKADEEYFLYDGDYYVKDTCNPGSTNTTSDNLFSDGRRPCQSTKYYFRCEPIKWRIVTEPYAGVYLLDCSTILNKQSFHVCRQDYASCSLRTWLNNDFYNKAFSISNPTKYIVPTILEDQSQKPKDNVWIGSQSEYSNWFVTTDKLQKKPSDFALCNGLCYSINDAYLRNSWYFTRTVSSSSVYFNHYIDYDGVLRSYYLTEPSGVSPCIQIKI